MLATQILSNGGNWKLIDAVALSFDPKPESVLEKTEVATLWEEMRYLRALLLAVFGILLNFLPL